MSMALRRHLFGGANHITAHHTHHLLKPKIGYWAPFNHNALVPPTTFPLLHGSSSSSSSAANPNSVSLLLCGGTCIYNGAQNDDWIIRLAQFAVDQYNHKEVIRNCMKLFYKNQEKQDRFLT